MQFHALAPCLLLAAPALRDPHFSRSVVLLASHDEQGSMGWVLNGRRIISLRTLLRDSGLVTAGASLPLSESYRGEVRSGGPVSPTTAWVIYEQQQVQHLQPGHIALADGWFGTGHREMIHSIAEGKGPKKFRFVLGYAGWEAHQLQREISEGMWLPVNTDPTVLRQRAKGGMWERCYKQLAGISPLAFGTIRGAVV